MGKELVVAGGRELSSGGSKLPAIVAASRPAKTAWRDFFSGRVANEHTRAAYDRAVRRFLAWCEDLGRELPSITPGDVGEYFRGLDLGTASKKQHLAGIRRFFNLLVERHICMINPAATAELERHQVVEGKTVEISPKQVTTLLRSIGAEKLVDLRDRAIIAVLASTAARAGAVAKLERRHLYHAGEQWMLHFDDKGGKSRELPVRHDLQTVLFAYLDAAGLREATKKARLFRTAVTRTNQFTKRPMTSHDICRMVKRRVNRAGLPDNLTAHSFRVMVITDLLDQGEDIKDVARLAGHADTRTTALYDRTEKKVTRNLVERIRLNLTPDEKTKNPEPAHQKVLQVNLHMQVENNSKFVRGKTRSRQEIEDTILSRFQMVKPDKDGWEYLLSIPYQNDDELDDIIYNEILEPAHSIADLRNGFVEADVRALDGSERSW